MNRLTERHDGWISLCPEYAAAERLAAYEDTGLSPDEILEMANDKKEDCIGTDMTPTLCDACVKNDVCKYKGEFASLVSGIFGAEYESADNVLDLVENSNLVDVSIKCKKMLTASDVREEVRENDSV